LEELIHYLHNIGEHSWIIMVIRYMYSKINEFQSFPDAINYIRTYIDFLINRSQFEVAFSIYDFIEDLFILKSDLGYSNILIELWIEASKKFVNIKDKKYLLQSLNKLNTHLKVPRTNEQIFHFFHTCNYLWQFKSLYYSLEPVDFWRMLFYRALFEENDLNLATKIISFLDNDLQASLSNLPQLHEESQSLKPQIYSFDDDVMNTIDPNFKISKLILYINSKGLISFRIKSTEGTEFEGKIQNEYWNDTQIADIYDDIFSFAKPKKYDLDLNEFGRIYYLSLPKLIRNIITQFEIKEEGEIPQVFIILNTMTIPFEFIHYNNFFLFQYSTSYRIGEVNIGGVSFERGMMSLEDVHDVLIIGAINDNYPTKWNEKKQVKELIYPFIEGKNELNHIVNVFRNSEKVNSMTILTESTCTRDKILSHLSQNKLHIIHFIGNIYYSKKSPKDSYFITNDKNIIKIEEILKAINQNSYDIYPLLFFNAQIFDDEGVKINNTTKILGELFSHFDYSHIKGIIARNFPVFTNESRKIITGFYNYILSKNNQGIALLKAISEDLSKKNIENNQSATLSSFILFGTPWNVL
ncbi:MAG: CHAT domain-containing protein, partial [Promethearchaeota archaeon]